MTTPDRDDNLRSQRQVQIVMTRSNLPSGTLRERKASPKTQRLDEIAFEGHEI